MYVNARVLKYAILIEKNRTKSINFFSNITLHKLILKILSK